MDLSGCVELSDVALYDLTGDGFNYPFCMLSETFPAADCCSGTLSLLLCVSTGPSSSSSAGPPTVDECCPEVNQVLFAHFENADNDVIELDYDPSTGVWIGTGRACGLTLTVTWQCYGTSPGDSWDLIIAGDWTDTDTGVPTCSPFYYRTPIALLVGAGTCASGCFIHVDDVK